MPRRKQIVTKCNSCGNTTTFFTKYRVDLLFPFDTKKFENKFEHSKQVKVTIGPLPTSCDLGPEITIDIDSAEEDGPICGMCLSSDIEDQYDE